MIDYGTMKDRLERFEAKHGVSVMDGGWLIFEDGAARELNPMGAWMEPPENEWDCARRILRFHEVRMQQAIKNFEDKRNDLLAEARVNLRQRFPGSPRDVKEVELLLNTLKDTVKKCKAGYEKALEEVRRVKPARIKEMEEQQKHNRAKNEELLSALKKIEV